MLRPPPFGHGVARVDRQVQDRRLELARIGEGRPQVGRQRDADLDVLAQACASSMRCIGSIRRLQLICDGLQHLAAAEREQPARQLGAALARGRDRVGGLLEVGAGV